MIDSSDMDFIQKANNQRTKAQTQAVDRSWQPKPYNPTRICTSITRASCCSHDFQGWLKLTSTLIPQNTLPSALRDQADGDWSSLRWVDACREECVTTALFESAAHMAAAM
jgi:hypothetical protein